MTKKEENLIDNRSQHLDIENRIKLPRLYLDVGKIKILKVLNEVPSTQPPFQPQIQQNNNAPPTSQQLQHDELQNVDPPAINQQLDYGNQAIRINEVVSKVDKSVTKDSTSTVLYDLLDDPLLQESTSFNLRSVKRNHLQMSTGLTKEETQLLIKIEFQKLAKEDEQSNLLRDQRIADLVNKYNALIIDFRKIKAPKTNDNQAPNLYNFISDTQKSTQKKGPGRPKKQ